eukprot:1574609-Pleurochrysis_carterae.AAC.1
MQLLGSEQSRQVRATGDQVRESRRERQRQTAHNRFGIGSGERDVGVCARVDVRAHDPRAHACECEGARVNV